MKTEEVIIDGVKKEIIIELPKEEIELNYNINLEDTIDLENVISEIGEYSE